jgi:exodeoxyribonuclease VII small subunit
LYHALFRHCQTGIQSKTKAAGAMLIYQYIGLPKFWNLTMSLDFVMVQAFAWLLNMSKDTRRTPPPGNFEDALTELESIVGKMESGQMPLEQSFIEYKRGVELLQACQKSLADVEQEIRILNESNQLQTFIATDD